LIIKILPINEISLIIINNLENCKKKEIIYFYDKTLFSDIKIYKYMNDGRILNIEKLRYNFNTKFSDFLLYNKITSLINCRNCYICGEGCCYPWYEKEMVITIDSSIHNNIENTLNLPIINHNIFRKLYIPRCICERCYDLFPYIKFYEISDKILLLKEFLNENFIDYDIKQYIFYFLIME
jgi:hypothetical protein